MSATVRVDVTGVGKKFCRSLKRSMIYGLRDMMGHVVGRPADPGRLRPEEFWALEEVTFSLGKGESFGIIGPNGSGKTTLLKMLNGIFMPDKGRIRIQGRVGALIQVGAGFHPMLSGRENIYVNGSILGMTRREIDERLQEIIRFADIGAFLDTPVKYYSSGMYVRLGFAIAVHCRPDILLIDEILAVGDSDFQMKCYRKMNEIKKRGTTIVLVSHNEYTIREETDRCLYLDRGQRRFLGNTEEGINLYIRDTLERQARATDKQRQTRPDDEDKAARILGLRFLNARGEEVSFLPTGETLVLEVPCEVRRPLTKPIFSVNFYGEGQFFYCANSHYEGVVFSRLEPGRWRARVTIPACHLPVHHYVCSVVIAEENESNLVDWHNMAYSFCVGRALNARGSMKLKTEWELREDRAA